MRSDWHRYNLKRRVASLPPLSSEIFAEKVLSAQENSSAAAAKAAFKETCAACQKTYYSENAYQNHLGSQRHRQRAATLEKNHGVGLDTPSVISSTISLGEPIGAAAREDVDDAEVEEEFAKVVSSMKDAKIKDVTPPTSRRPSRPHQSEPGSVPESPASPAETQATDVTQTSTAMPLPRCLFCNYDSPTFKLSILHMSRYHALFIPEQEYLVDMEGLIRYLQAKVVENHECLFCHKLKGSASGIQTHMRDKGHTMIAFDSEEEMVEIGQFYDFRSTYSDDEEEISDSDESGDEAQPSAASKLGARQDARQGAEEDDEGWETDSDESVDSDEIGSVPLEKDRTYRKNALARYRKEPHGIHASEGILPGVHPRHVAYSDGHELHLPSGRIAGHRHLARYYKQNLHNYPSPEERLVQQRLLADAAASGNSATGPVLTAKARQLARRPVSELGLVGLTDAKRRQITAVAQKQQTIGQRHEKQYRWNVEKRANNQKYYRDDNFGIRI
jgi:pre-60S factor REI1